MSLSAELRARREAVIREHFESENRQDFAATLATFLHPRYELIATGGCCGSSASPMIR